MLTQSLDSDIYDYGFILNSTALHEAAMSVLVTTIYGRWRGTTTMISNCLYRMYFLRIFLLSFLFNCFVIIFSFLYSLVEINADETRAKLPAIEVKMNNRTFYWTF